MGTRRPGANLLSTQRVLQELTISRAAKARGIGPEWTECSEIRAAMHLQELRQTERPQSVFCEV